MKRPAPAPGDPLLSLGSMAIGKVRHNGSVPTGPNGPTVFAHGRLPSGMQLFPSFETSWPPMSRQSPGPNGFGGFLGGLSLSGGFVQFPSPQLHPGASVGAFPQMQGGHAVSASTVAT